MNRQVWMVIAFAGVLCNEAKAASYIIASGTQGWVRSTGSDDGAANGNNTFTGNEFGGRFNSWASFDLSSVVGTVISAQLDITLQRYPGNDTANHTVGFNDVSTPYSSFTSSTSGVAGYTDLGTGNQYGTVTGANEEHFVALNAQAVSDINAASFGTFLIGFTNITMNGLPSGPADDIGIYTNGGLNGHPVLILETGVADAPEPSSIVLLGSAAAIFGGYSLKRRRK